MENYKFASDKEFSEYIIRKAKQAVLGDVFAGSKCERENKGIGEAIIENFCQRENMDVKDFKLLLRYEGTQENLVIADYVFEDDVWDIPQKLKGFLSSFFGAISKMEEGSEEEESNDMITSINSNLFVAKSNLIDNAIVYVKNIILKNLYEAKEYFLEEQQLFVLGENEDIIVSLSSTIDYKKHGFVGDYLIYMDENRGWHVCDLQYGDFHFNSLQGIENCTLEESERVEIDEIIEACKKNNLKYSFQMILPVYRVEDNEWLANSLESAVKLVRKMSVL